MEPTNFKTQRLLMILVICGLCATLVAWQQKQQKANSPTITQSQNTDTIPKKKEKKELKIQDLDEALEELDNVHIQIDMENLHKELAEIGPQVEREVAKAMKEVAAAIKEVDAAKISAEVNVELAKIDWKEIKEEIDASVSKIDWKKIQKELDKVKEIDLENIKVDMKNVEVEMKKIKPEIEKSLQGAKVEIEKAKAVMREYKGFVDGLENDGLIDKKHYSIKHKNGELIIDGKTQPASVYNKYHDFLDKHKTLTIEKSADHFNIDTDDNANE